jgi:hypothetical protein
MAQVKSVRDSISSEREVRAYADPEYARWRKYKDAKELDSAVASSELPSQNWAAATSHKSGAAVDDTASPSKPIPLWQQVSGTMPQAAKWVKKQAFPVRFADACLRGVGQVFLINNPVTGLLMCIGCALESWYILSMGLLGVLCSTGTALLLGFDDSSVASGLFGYNGFLVGMALSTFHFGGQDDPSAELQVLFPVAAMGAFSSVMTAGIGRATVSLLGIPPFTFPFQITTWIWLLGSQVCAACSTTGRLR